MAFRDENPTFGVVRFEPTQQPTTQSFLDGSMWYDSTAKQFKGIINGAVSNIGGGSSRFIDATSSKYGLFWDTKQISTATITSGSGNVSTSAVGTFSAADVGKTAYGFASCNTGTIPAGQAPIINGIIDGFSDSQHIHINVNATGSQASTACFYWGHPDDAALALIDADAVASATCPRIQLPAGMGMATQAHFISSIPACANTPDGLGGSLVGWGEVIAGYGKGVTILALAPSLASTNSATCNGGVASQACFGGQQGQVFRNMKLDGGGNYATGFPAVKRIIEFGSYSYADDFELVNYGASDGNLSIFLNGIGTVDWNNTTIVGGPTVNTNSGGTYNFTHSAVQENCTANQFNLSSGTLNSSNSYYSIGPCGPQFQTAINISGVLNSSGDLFFTESNPQQLNLIKVQGTGVLNLNGTTVAASGNALSIPVDLAASGAQLKAVNSTFIPGTSQTTAIFGVAGTKFFDLGGNTISGGVTGGATLIADGHSAKGTCTGTATSSSTLGLYGTGPNVTTTTCTSTTIGSGIVVSGSRTLQNLIVTASHAGVNASSGVVTVLRNGIATTLTCTIGTGTSCVDGTHTVALSDGDLISLQFTTQATEVLAGVSAIVEWN